MELFEAFPSGDTGVALPFFFLLGVTVAIQSSSSLVSLSFFFLLGVTVAVQSSSSLGSLWYASYKRNIAA